MQNESAPQLHAGKNGMKTATLQMLTVTFTKVAHLSHNLEDWMFVVCWEPEDQGVGFVEFLFTHIKWCQKGEVRTKWGRQNHWVSWGQKKVENFHPNLGGNSTPKPKGMTLHLHWGYLWVIWGGLWIIWGPSIFQWLEWLEQNIQTGSSVENRG